MNAYHYRRNYGRNAAEKSEKSVLNALHSARQSYNSMQLSIENGGTWTEKEIAKITRRLEKAQRDYNDLYGIS